MNNYEEISKIYRQNLEEDIISFLAQKLNLSIDEAMRIYYSSKLARQIDEGKYGIDNLDPKYLALDLIENESTLLD